MSLLKKGKSESSPLFDPWRWSNDPEKFFSDALERLRYREPFWTPETSSWMPRVNVLENGKEFKVTAELPGVDEKDIDITFQNNNLTVKGEKRMQKEEKKEEYQQIETFYGHFQRTIPFDSRIDEGGIKAEFKNGVLKLTLPKAEEEINRTRKIQID